MKLIIDIPEKAYELLKSKSELDNIAESIIANGKPYEERPQGEWQITKAGFAKCPNCKCEREYPENFCGYCGADMRGKEE
jgi:hypothetical protein